MSKRLLLAFVLAALAGLPAHAAPLRLTLGEAEARLAQNREILAAQRALDAARAGVLMAGQAPNPTLSYSVANASTSLGIGSGSLFDKRFDQFLGVSQLVERGDKRELRAASAEALATASAADLADSRRQQRLALHQSYYDLKAAEERARLLAETAELYERSVDLAQRRLKAGDIAAVEASRLRVEALRARNDARAAQADLVRSRQKLAYLIGEETRAEGIITDGAWPQAETPPALETALERRPDVRAAQRRIEAAREARALAKSQATRDVTLGAQVGRTLGYSSYMPGVNYGLSVSIPLFVRYGFEGEIAKAEADYGAALENRERVLAQARVETVSAHADLAAAADRRRRAEAEALPEARRVAEAAEFAHKKGALGLTDLLDARRTLRAVELDTVAALADHAKARAGWLAATEWEKTEP